MTLDVKFKKHSPDAVIPSYAKSGDNGLDLTAISYRYVEDTECPYHEYQFGISVEIPPGYVGLLLPRSSNSKTDLVLANSTGVIDTNFRGPLSARFKEVYREKNNMVTDDCGNPTIPTTIFNVGDRVVQLVIVPCPTINVIEAEELSTTERGSNGWGSSGS